MARWRFRSNLFLLTHRPVTFARLYRWPLALLGVGAVLDGATTFRFMVRLGVGEELHPAMRVASQILGPSLGVPLGTLAKVGFAIFVAALWRRWTGVLLCVCGLLYCAGAVWNHLVAG